MEDCFEDEFINSWPPKIKKIYLNALNKLNGNDNPLHFGPSHIVWDDGNFDSAEWCIDHFDEYSEYLSESEKTIVMQSLVELSEIPIKEREMM